MCLPAISFAVGALSSIASFAAQSADASAQTATWKENYVNSLAAARGDQQQITTRQMQEGDALAQKDHLAVVDQAEKSADTLVSGATSGVAGTSLNNLLADVGRKTAGNRVTYLQNWKATAQQLQATKDATVTTAKSRINSVSPGTPPSPLGLVAGIAGAGIKSFATA